MSTRKKCVRNNFLDAKYIDSNMKALLLAYILAYIGQSMSS